MASLLRCLTLAIAATGGAAVWAQPGAEAIRPPAVLPQAAEPTPKLIAYPPLAEALARGVVIIQFRTEHLRVMPVFGKAAVEVSPRLGHLHVTVDKQAGTWAHTSEDPIIVVGLATGQHNIVLEIADPAHRILTSETVSFLVPPPKEGKARAQMQPL